MTPQEAINKLNNMKEYYYNDKPEPYYVGFDNEDNEALDMAIKALEQQPCEGMRDATEEERESTKAYIDSISKPTGLQFDDTYEEIDFVQPHKKISAKLRLCEDCISREEVISEIDRYIDKAQSTGTKDAFISFQELVVKQLPSVTPKGVTITDFADRCRECGRQTGWIPVSERLPEDEQEILFSTKTGRVQIGKYHDDDSANQWYSYRDKCRAWNNVVTAWMPLPQPYKEESEEEE